jgi:hypothetical protein
MVRTLLLCCDRSSTVVGQPQHDGCRYVELFSAVNPSQDQPNYSAEANRTEKKRASDGNGDPRDYDEADGNDCAGFRAGYGQVPEGESLGL